MIFKLIKYKDHPEQDGGNPPLRIEDNTLYLEGDEILIFENDRNDKIGPDGEVTYITGFRINIRRDGEIKHKMFIRDEDVAAKDYEGYIINNNGKTIGKPIR